MQARYILTGSKLTFKNLLPPFNTFLIVFLSCKSVLSFLSLDSKSPSEAMYFSLGSIPGEECVECIGGSTGLMARAIDESCEDLSGRFSWPPQIDLTVFLELISPSQMI